MHGICISSLKLQKWAQSTLLPHQLPAKKSPDLLRITLDCKRRRMFHKPSYKNSISHDKLGLLSTLSPRHWPLPKYLGKGNSTSLGKPSILPFAEYRDSFSESEEEEEEEEEDHQALEAVLRLYSTLKNRDLQGLSDVLCEECQCMSNFVSTFKPLQGKQQVMEFFSSLMKSLGDNVEFIVELTSHNGLNIGVSWRLECKKTHAPLGKGFSFHMCHVYKGKVFIRNVDMFMEPLIHFEPLRLKIMQRFVTLSATFMQRFVAVMSTMGCYKLLERLVRVNKALYVLLSLISMLLSLFFLKQSLS